MTEKTQALEDKISGSAEYLSEREVRADCVKLAVAETAVVYGTGKVRLAAIVETADTLAQYVLTGKKPGEA